VGDGAELHLVEALGPLLAVAGDKGNGGPVVEELDRGADGVGGKLKDLRDAWDDVRHGRRLTLGGRPDLVRVTFDKGQHVTIGSPFPEERWPRTWGS